MFAFAAQKKIHQHQQQQQRIESRKSSSSSQNIISAKQAFIILRMCIFVWLLLLLLENWVITMESTHCECVYICESMFSMSVFVYLYPYSIYVLVHILRCQHFCFISLAQRATPKHTYGKIIFSLKAHTTSTSGTCNSVCAAHSLTGKNNALIVSLKCAFTPLSLCCTRKYAAICVCVQWQEIVFRSSAVLRDGKIE